MTYDYITDNNLYNKQNYMYSRYCGMDFIKAYIDSRNIKNKTFVQRNVKALSGLKSETAVKLNRMLSELSNNDETGIVISELNGYVKSFEVRKRLYDGYVDWKPLDGAGFEDYESYLTFSECLIYAYSYTGNLKYFSCLLKVDDTLLSLYSELTGEQTVRLDNIIDRELLYFRQMLEQHGIRLEV
jgi:hypothetical protein